MYGLFGKMRAQSGQRDALLNALLQAAEGMKTLDGCYVYIVGTDPEDTEGIWVQEVWRSAEDHRASLTPETMAFIATVRPLIADMGPRYEFTPIGGKGLPQPDASA